jgi:dTDP-4-dehydrorhamnose 3,5-epimerase
VHVELELPGVHLFSYPRNSDERGHFERVYNEADLMVLSLNTTWPQHNSSFNIKMGTIRGLHYQLEPAIEDKFVRCTSGAIYEVLIDLRPDSSHYLKWISLNLSAAEPKGLYIPGGVAHGFQTLEDGTTVSYLNSVNYDPSGQAGVNPVSSSIDFNWPLGCAVISERDLSLPRI